MNYAPFNVCNKPAFYDWKTKNGLWTKTKRLNVNIYSFLEPRKKEGWHERQEYKYLKGAYKSIAAFEYEV